MDVPWVVLRRVSVLLTVVIVALGTSPLLASARASRQGAPSVTTAASKSRTASDSTIVPIATVAVTAPRDAASLLVGLQQLVAGSGGAVGVTVVELGGTYHLAGSLDGDAGFTAATTYKLVPPMMCAQNIPPRTTPPPR